MAAFPMGLLSTCAKVTYCTAVDHLGEGYAAAQPDGLEILPGLVRRAQSGVRVRCCGKVSPVAKHSKMKDVIRSGPVKYVYT